jgi:REP element-mobilizing transposase RayT
VVNALGLAENRKLHRLSAFVVMPNHVHALLQPLVPLAKVTHGVKGYTAYEANLILGRKGAAFWQHESYDHWVRTEDEYNRIVRYVEFNPVSAGLAGSIEEWAWSSGKTNLTS